MTDIGIDKTIVTIERDAELKASDPGKVKLTVRTGGTEDSDVADAPWRVAVTQILTPTELSDQWGLAIDVPKLLGKVKTLAETVKTGGHNATDNT
jgi:hypothetical protein